VSPVKYELGFYIPEDDILHSHRRETLKSYKKSLLLARREYTRREHALQDIMQHFHEISGYDE
jgi:hypothetical protein